MLDLYLIRHGQTLANRQRRYPAEDEDPPLSPDGRRQAQALVLPEGRVYSSPARRARETAEQAGRFPVQVSPALAEAHFGVMAGHTWAELEARYGATPAGWVTALSDPAAPDGPPEGESGEAFHARIDEWLQTLPLSGTVLAFTHLGPVLAALRLTVGLRAAELPTCGVVHLRRSEQAWWLVRLGPGPG
ncbi:histidine phosphatase family protein [Deinococcus sonorensis]|uniref:Histidine phosphatase family protein n=2 Tax=Deinococcus sonorensis TaxID=309891 RepID=A0AAU7UFM4_9DEIO